MVIVVDGEQQQRDYAEKCVAMMGSNDDDNW